MSNPSTIYATTFVDELIRAGLKHVCFVPGSRHTPLILAFARHRETINIYSHLDERSASFFALGLALATDEPVAIVCTSGTAGANFFPAIIEAHQSRVPLIVLTADRPHELRQSGANQTIDQVKMFGDFVLWFYDAPLPEVNPPDVALRNLRTLAARTYAKADGVRKGVVHINMPFRKPLEPEHADDYSQITSNTSRKVTEFFYEPGTLVDVDEVYWSDILNSCPKGIIICGPNVIRTSNDIHQTHSLRLAQVSSSLNYPIISDPISGIRFTNHVNAIGSYETFLSEVADYIKPDIIIRFGNVPTSKWLNDFITKSNVRHYWHVAEDGVWSDDSHLITRVINADLSYFCNELDSARRHQEHDNSLVDTIRQIEETTWQVIDHEIETGDYFDGGVVYDVVDLIPDGSTLFAGNSLPVRHLDQFGKPTNKRIFAYANRGASGIDGNISTALGAGTGRPDKPLVAILGDITFYHDMNGLLVVHRCGVPITIVLLNNDGGGIFHRLPIREHAPSFTDYFVTAHGLDYSHAAKLYGLDYVRADTRDAFRQAFSESVTNRTSTIIEVRTDAQADLQRRNEIVSAVHARLKELDL